METGRNATKIKLAEQNLVIFRARLKTTANKDEVRRQIAATLERLRELRGEESL